MEISYKEAVKMRKRMKPIPGFPRYGIYNGKVWSHRYGKFVAVRRGNVEVWSESGRKHHMPVAKLVYCADNGIDPRECPDGYSFYLDGDGSPCVRMIGEAHSEAIRKMDERRKSDENVNAVKRDYEKASYYQRRAGRGIRDEPDTRNQYFYAYICRQRRIVFPQEMKKKSAREGLEPMTSRNSTADREDRLPIFTNSKND